jgi:DNA-binding protein HU-beta
VKQEGGATMRVERIFSGRQAHSNCRRNGCARKFSGKKSQTRKKNRGDDCFRKLMWLSFTLRCEAQVRGRFEGERMASVVTKSDLVQAAARAGNLSKLAAGEAVNAVFDAIVANVARGKRVTVVGFGTFLPRKRKARAGRSPANGKEIRILAKTVPAFAAGQGFKDRVGER